uniref:Uncharacterized protein n=1 Tax=viral metagenome TaxID=1070528 RepID=A0A6C0LSV9_9ZZZZ
MPLDNIKKFYADNKKVIILFVIIIIALLIYRYFWKRESITNDFLPTKKEKQLCINKDTQKKISEEINKKLQEINACDCKETCESSPIRQKTIEIFGNDDFY